MGAELLTAGEVSTRLAVDRSTVYRMAMDGRLRAVKIGSQWRFPPAALEEVLADHVTPIQASHPGQTRVPLAVARKAVLEGVAPLLGVTMVVTDMDGHLQTDVVNPCRWFTEHGEDPSVLEACSTQWRGMAADHVFTPRLELGSHGMACARSFVRDGDKLVGMLVAGGIAPEDHDPTAAAAAGLHHLDPEQRARLLAALPRIAASISSLFSPTSRSMS